MKTWLSDLACRIGKYLAKTRFGIFIIANSYVHENYEWYRKLIFHSDYSLEEIRECIRQKDYTGMRSDWLFSRSRCTRQRCTDTELEELVTYLEEPQNDPRDDGYVETNQNQK